MGPQGSKLNTSAGTRGQFLERGRNLSKPALITRLTPLLEPSELQLMGLAQPLLQLRGATAALERQRSLKRCRHLLDAWSSQRLETLERCIALLLEEERRYLTELDSRRCAGYEEVAQQPSADAVSA